MARPKASICPVCKKPVAPEQTVYTINEQDYHPECYQKWEASLGRSERGEDGG